MFKRFLKLIWTVLKWTWAFIFVTTAIGIAFSGIESEGSNWLGVSILLVMAGVPFMLEKWGTNPIKQEPARPATQKQKAFIYDLLDQTGSDLEEGLEVEELDINRASALIEILLEERDKHNRK